MYIWEKLLNVKKLTDPLEYRFFVVAPFHEENNFPTCVAIHRINLKDRSILFYFIYIYKIKCMCIHPELDGQK